MWSYYKKFASSSSTAELTTIIYKRDNPKTVAKTLADADVVGFSLYVWNEQISLAIINELKKLNSNVKIICGGPQVPDYGIQYLEKNESIDILVHGEGEQAFSNILDNLSEAHNLSQGDLLAGIKSISYRKVIGPGKVTFQTTTKALRLASLEELPSPFLDGTFEWLMSRNPGQQWMALWETNRGCPFTCTFCDWGSATNAKVSRFSLERLQGEIEWIASKNIEFVFVCDANFGLLPRDLEIASHIVRVVSKYSYPKRVSTQGAKNVTERSYQVQKILLEAKVGNGAALSMQSLDGAVLSAIKRENISLDSYYELQKRYSEAGIPTYVDLILGLPMETIDSFKNGVDRLIENGCHEHIQFNNLTLLPNAEMSKHKDTYGLEVISAPVWSLHAKANHSEEYVREIQDLVISTKSLPKDDWRESRVFAWMASLIHLNKIAQPIILLARSQSDFSYRQIIDQVINTTWNAIICYVVNRMRDFALSVQKEGREYFAEKRYLGINWTVDELTFIDLVEKNKLEQFIQEIASLLFHHVRNNSGFSTNFKTLEKAFCEASEISYKSLILPGENLDESLKLETNVVEVINQIRAGTKVNLRETSQVIVYEREKQVELRNLDFDRWMREVVWYRNKRGAYTWDSKLNDLGIPEGHLR